MKYKSLVPVLVLFLAASLSAQDGVYEWVTHKPMGEDTPQFNIQVAKGDKTGAMLSTCWVIPDFDDGKSLDDIEVNWVRLSEAEEISFLVNYTALFTTKVRFRLIITGPTFYMRTSEHWYDAKYRTSSLYGVGGVMNNFDFTRGEYTVIFIAEQQKPYGGSECVASCTFRVY